MRPLVERLLGLDPLRRLPHLIQLAAVALKFIQEPVQVLEHENLVQRERREDAVDADLDTLHLRLGGPVDRDARHAHAVHRAAGGELAAPLAFRLRAAGTEGNARLRRIQVVRLFPYRFRSFFGSSRGMHAVGLKWPARTCQPSGAKAVSCILSSTSLFNDVPAFDVANIERAPTAASDARSSHLLSAPRSL